MERVINCICGRRLLLPAELTLGELVCPACGKQYSDIVPRALPVDLPRHAAPQAFPVLPVAQVVAAGRTRPASEFEFRNEDLGIGTRKTLSSLYSAQAVALAGLLGGVFAGLFVVASNYQRLKQRGAAVVTIIAMVVAVFGIFFVVSYYDEVPLGIAAAVPLGMIFTAQLMGGAMLSGAAAWLLQRRAIAFQRAEGGELTPARRLVGPALFASAIVFGLQIIIYYPFAWDGMPPTRTLYYGTNQTITYSATIPKVKALSVRTRLHKVGVIQQAHPQGFTIFLLRRDDHYELRLFVHPETVHDDFVLQVFRDLRRDLEIHPFDDLPLRIKLCNPLGQLLMELR